MRPFERLRSLARWNDDGTDLLDEAVECLAAFDDDPAGLVVACRRLLAHHTAVGGLWWLCSRVLAAAEPADAAWEAWQVLREDPTAPRLAGQLPFPHDDPIAVLGWTPVVGAALAQRPDLDVVSVRPRRDDGARGRLRHEDRLVRVLAAHEVLPLSPTHLLVEASAVAPGVALAPPGTGELAAAMRGHGAEVWLVAGTAQVLPAPLFAAMERALASGERLAALDLDAVDRVAGPRGLELPTAAARHPDCPVAPELLRHDL